MRFSIGIGLIMISWVFTLASAFLLLISAKAAVLSYAGSWAMLGSGVHLAGPKGMRKMIALVLRR